ncbi:MAG: hypothetical protein RMK18_01230 [Armatimonadota bacterium]|nr:hypothetical protein [Armatimonadota bacterium]MCX7776837.1 hypothetical protein [Armatimonadota bacterium]MDW8024477.1 hypothetical protein [Armatimonadota bacterium]
MRDGQMIAGSIVGMLTFIGGITLLVISFVLTCSFFNQLGHERMALFHNSPQEPKMLMGAMLSWVLRSVFRLICLLVMGFIASLIAARGAQMYGASRVSAGYKPQGHSEAAN